MSVFSMGSATKGALILVGIGVAAIGLGMILKGTANVVHEVRDRGEISDSSQEEENGSEKSESASSEDETDSESEKSE
jgi:hypothetical protein